MAEQAHVIKFGVHLAIDEQRQESCRSESQDSGNESRVIIYQRQLDAMIRQDSAKLGLSEKCGWNLTGKLFM